VSAENGFLRVSLRRTHAMNAGPQHKRRRTHFTRATPPKLAKLEIRHRKISVQSVFVERNFLILHTVPFFPPLNIFFLHFLFFYIFYFIFHFLLFFNTFLIYFLYIFLFIFLHFLHIFFLFFFFIYFFFFFFFFFYFFFFFFFFFFFLFLLFHF